jgi:hypothetical protein
MILPRTKVGIYAIAPVPITEQCTFQAPSCAAIQQELMQEEIGNTSIRGQTSWIACGLRIQEMQ